MPAVRLDTYRQLTLAGSLAGAGLFAAGLAALVRLQDPGLAAALMVSGIAAALATALLEIEGAPAAVPASLLLYTRAECALCDEARARLEALRRELPFDLWEADVAQAPALKARYGEVVPVGVVRGEEVFRLQLDEARVRAALQR